MKTPRITAALALAAAGALVLGACSTPATDDSTTSAPPAETSAAPVEDATTPADVEEPAPPAADSIAVGWNEPLKSLNDRTPNGNATSNVNIEYLMRALITYYDKDLNLIRNTDFVSFEIVNEDPLTVTYTIQPGVTWSDGTPVDAVDLLLEWAGTSGVFNDDVAINEESGEAEVAEGQVYFAGSDPAIQKIQEVPTLSEDHLSITFVYSVNFADWQFQYRFVGVPAHVTAKKALDITDNTEAKQALVDAVNNNDREALAKIATFWNTGFDFASLPSDPDLYLSCGAYLMTEYVESQYMTLEANPAYTWGPKPTVNEIVIRYSEDPMASVQALQNGEVDIIQPQSTPDVLSALEGMSNVEYITTPAGTYEHVDLTFNNNGPFDARSYDGGEATAKLVRQAFLKALPRQQIIDTLILPLNPNAVLRDAFSVVPGSPEYAATIAANGSAEYDVVDIEGAKALLEQAGVTTPIDVRFLYGKNNQRRANEYQLISESVAQAGFNLIDNGDDKWGMILGSGTYDASLFGWQTESLAVTEPRANFGTGLANNFGGYTNAEVDALYDQLDVELDPAKQAELNTQIEALLWADGFGAPIFQFPEITAWNTRVSGVESPMISPTVFSNFWDWTLS